MNYFLVYLAFSFGTISSQTSVEIPKNVTSNSRLTIHVQNIKTLDGDLKIGIFNTDADFLEENSTVKAYTVAVDEATETLVIDDLPEGDYAISMYHDENSDGILNRNFFGIPKEPYGFSNNIKPKLSAPDYEDCKFIFIKDCVLEINLVH